MNQPVIQVKNLSKVYNIGHEQRAAAGNATIRDILSGAVRKPLELVTGHKLEKEKFWALKDVSFEVDKGDVIGIIGRNGSGKSTLLKVLSRIVDPTEGEVVMRGKVASLLEVGTGFHPELTGRENIYFNGAILGMSQKEIKAKFDEIVAFSEVEKFLDTPVKFYSSGMYVRLAFSVAAHLDPDILIVDEVLAVGDAAFQKKCLGKMKDVAGQGRTVLFVSHSMDAVKSLCDKAILMRNGSVVATGDLDEVVTQYLDSGIVDDKAKFEFKPNNEKVGQIIGIEINDLKGDFRPRYRMDEDWAIDIKYKVNKQISGAITSIQFVGPDGNIVYTTADADTKKEIETKLPGDYSYRVKVPSNFLTPGVYGLNVAIQVPGVELIDMTQEPLVEILINAEDIRASYFSGKYFGHYAGKLEWDKLSKQGSHEGSKGNS